MIDWLIHDNNNTHITNNMTIIMDLVLSFFFIKLHIWLFQYLFLWWLLVLLIINSYELFSHILIILIPFTVIILIITCYSHTHWLFYINLVLIRYRTLHWVYNSSIWIITHVIVRSYYVVAAHYFILFHFISVLDIAFEHIILLLLFSLISITVIIVVVPF